MRIFQPTISGSTNTTGSLVITGSLRVSEGITGSLFGTSSWATNALTSSLATRNLLTASVSSNTITFTKGDGSTFNLTIDTGSGGGGGGGVTINNNVDNYIVTATGTANTLNGESGLTYNGVNLVISGGLITSGTLIISGTLEATSIKSTRVSSQGIGNYGRNAEIADTFWTDSSASLFSGSIVYYKYDVTSGSLWRNALADTGSGIYKLGVVTKAESQDDVLIRGTINVKTDLDGLGAKPGDILYLSPTTAGEVTNIVPTGSGQVARVLGYVFSPTSRTMIFDPSSTWIEL